MKDMDTFGVDTPQIERDESVVFDSDDSEKFKIKSKVFSQQFSHVYFLRLNEMRSLLKKRLKKEGLKLCEKNVLNLPLNEECIITGTLYKEMKLKSNILLEYTKEKFVEGSDVPSFTDNSNRVSEDDVLILEDERGRINIEFEEGLNLKADLFLTGTVAALKGKQNESGAFITNKVFFAGAQPQKPVPKFKEDVYVAFLGGIQAGSKKFDPMAVQAMVDFLNGSTGSETEQSNTTKKIVKCIVCGNICSAPETNTDGFNVKGSLRAKDISSLVNPLKLADYFLSQISKTISIDVMPGENDGTNPSLPQQPIHPSMCPRTSRYQSTNFVTNPYSINASGLKIMCTSGQTINDMRKYCSIQSSISLMEETIKYAHISPTAPDTLMCYPFKENDPFILKESPHVYCVGNQDSFDTKLLQEDGKLIRLISVPSFINTNQIVLLNLKTLDCFPITFNIGIENKN